MAKIIVCKFQIAFADTPYEVKVEHKGKIVAVSARLRTYDECREWISGIKKVTKFTKVEDQTGEE